MKFLGISALLSWVSTAISAVGVWAGVDSAQYAAIGFGIISVVATIIVLEMAQETEE